MVTSTTRALSLLFLTHFPLLLLLYSHSRVAQTRSQRSPRSPSLLSQPKASTASLSSLNCLSSSLDPNRRRPSSLSPAATPNHHQPINGLMASRRWGVLPRRLHSLALLPFPFHEQR